MTKPTEFAAWPFSAGIPDPRGDRYPHQPLVPPQCFPALSQMLWDLGFRHHEEEQVKWVNPRSGPAMNFEAWGLTDKSPAEVAEELAKSSPELAQATANAIKSVQTVGDGEKLHQTILDGVRRIEQLQAQLRPGGNS